MYFSLSLLTIHTLHIIVLEFDDTSGFVIFAENVSIPNFAFGWSDEKDTFAAGDIATIKVKILGNYEGEKYKYTFHPNITVNGKMGNSSLVSGVCLNFDGELSDWRISFVPIKVGLFNVLVTDEHFNVLDSSLHFQVTPGFDLVFNY